jgi:hypothetical protein
MATSGNPSHFNLLGLSHENLAMRSTGNPFKAGFQLTKASGMPSQEIVATTRFSGIPTDSMPLS